LTSFTVWTVTHLLKYPSFSRLTSFTVWTVTHLLKYPSFSRLTSFTVYFKKWVTVQTVKLVNLLKEGYFKTWVTVQTVKLVNLEVVLLLPNTDRLQQVEDYVRGCSTSTKYWLSSAIWRICQRLFYFYQILTAFNKLKMRSEVTHDNAYILLEFLLIIVAGFATWFFGSTLTASNIRPWNLRSNRFVLLGVLFYFRFDAISLFLLYILLEFRTVLALGYLFLLYFIR
jgi:hypothetical protein